QQAAVAAGLPLAADLPTPLLDLQQQAVVAQRPQGLPTRPRRLAPHQRGGVTGRQVEGSVPELPLGSSAGPQQLPHPLGAAPSRLGEGVVYRLLRDLLPREATGGVAVLIRPSELGEVLRLVLCADDRPGQLPPRAESLPQLLRSAVGPHLLDGLGVAED